MQFTQLHSSSSGNLYRASNDQGAILIEAGVPLKKIKHALDFCLSSIEGVLVTHSHLDHSCGVKDVMRAGIDCYMTQETADALGLDGHRLHIVEPMQQFKVGSWTAIPFQAHHDCPGAVGYLVSDGVEKLLFATDTFYVHYRFHGLNIVAVECNYSPETISPDCSPARKKRLYSSHMSLENCIRLLKANDLSKVKEIHLIHMSRDNSDPAAFQKAVHQATGIATYIMEDHE